MSVNLGCRNTCVPQELLDLAQLGAALQQMGRKGMAQCVRGYPGRDAGGFGIVFDQEPEPLTC